MQEDNLAEQAIQALNATAKQLIQDQNELEIQKIQALNTTSSKLKKKEAKSTVIKSIGVGGTSIFSADINKYMNRDPNRPQRDEDRFEPPHKQLDVPESEIKEDQWFKMYGDLVTKYEEQFAENEKMKIEIARRVERYNHNERDYR